VVFGWTRRPGGRIVAVSTYIYLVYIETWEDSIDSVWCWGMINISPFDPTLSCTEVQAQV
jgi:hypothetical protein